MYVPSVPGLFSLSFFFFFINHWAKAIAQAGRTESPPPPTSLHSPSPPTPPLSVPGAATVSSISYSCVKWVVLLRTNVSRIKRDTFGVEADVFWVNVSLCAVVLVCTGYFALASAAFSKWARRASYLVLFTPICSLDTINTVEDIRIFFFLCTSLRPDVCLCFDW